jgi:enediyne polyketide synthase
VAALVTDLDEVDVVIHSEETGYAAEHFRARLCYRDAGVPQGPPEQVPDGLPMVELDPAADLYDGILFQGGRFQRLRGYHRAAAREVDVEVAALARADWFASYLPGALLLGDPGVRDALMHGNQVCVPDATLLPAGIDRLHPAGDRLSGAQQLRFCAVERCRDGDTYTYDIALRTPAGEVIERWEGLRLRAVRRTDGNGRWVAPLLGPYLERTVEDLVGAAVAVAVEPDGGQDGGSGGHGSSGHGSGSGGHGSSGHGSSGHGSGGHVARRRARTALAASRVLGRPVGVRYRPDGRPEVAGERGISAAHGAGVTLCVAGAGPVGCDVETVVPRADAERRDLLGPHARLADLVATVTGEDADTAATRIWTAIECLRKAGRSGDAPLVLLPASRPGWSVFSSGDLRIAVLACTVGITGTPAVFAILTEGRR